MNKKKAGERREKQDYLRVIYEFDEGKGVRSVDIAKKLSISKASVSEMLRKLAGENLVKIKPYSKTFLTRKGKIEAGKISARHFIIKKFMRKFLTLGDEKAREEAHKLEHAFSDEAVKVISNLVEENYETEEVKLKAFPNYIG